MIYQVELNGKLYFVELYDANVEIKNIELVTKKETILHKDLSDNIVNTPNLPSLYDDIIDNKIKALMPGVIIKILKKEGDEIFEGDVLMIIESMKMENEIVADRNGVIGKIYFNKGERVSRDSILMVYTD